MAQNATFIAKTDRTQVALGDSFLYEITLSLSGAEASAYRPPDFKGFRVLGEHPSQSTQIQMGGGGSFMQTVYSWRYELQPIEKGSFAIAPARVRADGKEIKTATLTIVVGDRAAAPRPAQPRGGVRPFPQGFPFGGVDPDPRPPQPQPPVQTDGDSGNFIRAMPDRTSAYVGEQITVQWFLYLTERQDKYQTVTEPRADGFWSEDLPIPNSGRGLSLTPQIHDGRTYLVAPLLKKGLFPLQPGKLTITPLESEVSQVDFFGSVARNEKLRALPILIEVVPLPTEGRPAGFDAASVGRFQIAARLDRDRVSVGEAVTLTVTVSGRGNLRKLAPPKLAQLDGWKSYEPKISVEVAPAENDIIAGKKSVEYLLLPERAGVTSVPAFELPFFDPALKAYLVEKTSPLRIEVVGEAPAGAGVGGAAGRGPAAAVPGTGIENTLPTEIRPLRARPGLRRDVMGSFYRSRAFAGAVVAPPLVFGLTVLVGRVRGRLAQETLRSRRRKLRRLLRRRLGAAEAHLEAGRTAPFYIEIDRVLGEILVARLGQPIAGLSRDELRALLLAQGLTAGLADQTLGELEECDRARFSPGSLDTAAMRAALERAEELILQLEKSNLARTQESTLS